MSGRKVRIWFNRSFAVGYHYINAVRHNEDGMAFEIYGTHRDPEHVSLRACDYTEVEPVLSGEAYAAYCLDFCRRHQIEVFVPRWGMRYVVAAADAFAEMGVKLVCCTDRALLDQVEDKGNFFLSAEENNLMIVPEYRLVHTANEFKKAYEELRDMGLSVCFKPTRMEGGVGFRIIDPNYDPLTALFDTVSAKMSYEQAYHALSQTDSFPELMVMELLEGYEYSIDCLASPEGELLAAVPRRKAGGRSRLLEEVPELLEIARKVAQFYKIPYNYNLQLIYQGNVPKALEINPRMSGGLHMTCLSGVNFPYLAVKMALGYKVDPQTPEYGLLTSYVEQPVLMEGQPAQ
ncbi:ATP-grasp domain-containing protein [Paenibacillus bovis]|uniref:Carbamoyl-phosphate synthase large subunit n=1 Tax=Paenibacillus bovis TaxID=1616788 RepID=A0A172ZBI9_9BACL|nr:ATP-grasp domain-containing protein [Paenibacillus bovis]ANF94627.1 carbamoyl-phosphate synthase large subunit [Paenibacillus bovis]